MRSGTIARKESSPSTIRLRWPSAAGYRPGFPIVSCSRPKAAMPCHQRRRGQRAVFDYAPAARGHRGIGPARVHHGGAFSRHGNAHRPGSGSDGRRAYAALTEATASRSSTRGHGNHDHWARVANRRSGIVRTADSMGTYAAARVSWASWGLRGPEVCGCPPQRWRPPSGLGTRISQYRCCLRPCGVLT